MLLTSYCNRHTDSASVRVVVSREQASAFAKQVAQDFNPIHDVDAKRFCVPGDLLFALVLTEYGLQQKMRFHFSGMVGDQQPLVFPEITAPEFSICDPNGKAYLTVQREGASTQDQAKIETLIRRYVAFSGLNFIHVLVPMMRKQQVMLNPERPLVIYESMSIDLQDLDFADVNLSLVKQELTISGKRGDVCLSFELHCGERLIGTGEKTLVLSGLRALDEEKMQQMCDLYESFKACDSTK